MDIDQGKLNKVTEAIGWLQQAQNHYKWRQHEIADSCLKKARSAVNDPCFDRKPIFGFSRDQQPETVRIVADNPLGFCIINGSDYDEAIHELYVESIPGKQSKRSR